jgi:hypothetical protein
MENVMRTIKILIYVILSAVIAVNCLRFYNKINEKSISEYVLGYEEENEIIVDKEIIIEKLSEKFQVVGLEGDITKEFNYSDNKWYGDKYYKMELYGKFKFGFNIDEITKEDITIIDNNVIIDMPNIVLISLEVPYDKIVIDKKEGIFRKMFSEDDRQKLYESAYKSINEQIINDNALIKNAEENNELAIRSILILIPEIKTISFK